MSNCGNGCGCEFDSNYIDNLFYTDLPVKACPDCGCSKVASIGNEVVSPENWTRWNCIKCNKLIAQIDNSPMGYCWEFEDGSF